jgi:hypothetical protein
MVIPGAINGTEQRLDAILTTLEAIAAVLDKSIQTPPPLASEDSIVLKEPAHRGRPKKI